MENYKSVSRCCGAEAYSDVDFEGTGCMMCRKCDSPCQVSELIIIKDSLTSLNEYIDKQRINKYVGAECKKKNTNAVAWQLPNIKIDYKIDIDFLWFCKDKRQDKDNICFTRKFILDGMIKKGIIPNDGWKEIGNFKDNFYIDKQNPRVELRITQSNEK